MKPIKKFIIIKLAILILAQSLTLSSNAFFTCPEQKCRKKVYSSFEETNSKIILLENNNRKFLINSGGNNNNNENSGNNNGGIVPPNNPNANKAKACAINNQILSNQISFLECQINSAERKASDVLNLANRLARALDNLLNIMQGARVCTPFGYTNQEYNARHNISTNIATLSLIQKDISKLKNELAKVSLNCDNCDDNAALIAELQKLTLIQNSLNSLKDSFNSELNIIANKMNSFVAHINRVIRRHSVDVRGIQIECGVSRVVARRMRASRLSALRAFRNFVDQLRKIFAEINNVNFSSHGCTLNNEINEDLVFECLGIA